MRKLNLLMGLAILSLIGLFTSCSTDDTAKPPSITFNGGSNISTDDTVLVGSTFSIGITALPNSESGEKLVSFKAIRTFNNVPSTMVDTTLDKLTSFSASFEIEAQNTVGSERFTFTVVDKNGESAEISLNVYTKTAAGIPINKFTAVLMGAQSNTSDGSTASLFTGTVYKISGSEAKNNSDKVDVVYYFGSKEAAIYAPTQSDIQAVTAFGISTWATKNDTKLGVSTLSASLFDAIIDESGFASAGTTNLDVVPNLAVNDVIAFVTAAGKKGVFKVTALTTGASGSITIYVKVQK